MKLNRHHEINKIYSVLLECITPSDRYLGGESHVDLIRKMRHIWISMVLHVDHHHIKHNRRPSAHADSQIKVCIHFKGDDLSVELLSRMMGCIRR
jgi:hypothetical protein